MGLWPQRQKGLMGTGWSEPRVEWQAWISPRGPTHKAEPAAVIRKPHPQAPV